MGVVPQLQSSCFCCTLKTGSFVTAWLLLVGSSVQTGFYAFLVDHMNPQKICSYPETFMVVDRPAFRDYDYYYYPREENLPLWWNYRNGRPHDQDTVNKTHRDISNKSYAANTTDGRPGNSSHTAQHAANTTAGQQTDSSYAANTTAGQQTISSYTANTTARVPTNSSLADRTNSTARGRRWTQRRQRSLNWFRGLFPRYHIESRLKQRRCPRFRVPFDADSNFLDFEVTKPINKTILYVNIVIWAIMMAGTTLLMAAVYKERASMVCAWLVLEALLLTVATPGAVATAVLMFRTLPVQIGIVTLLNMAIHLGIDIYLMMVVENYRRKLTTKENDEEEEQVIV